MKQLYYRIYYTLYKSLLWLGQSHETDMVRFNVVFIQSLFTGFMALGTVGLLIEVIGTSIILHSTIQTIIFALCVLGANCYMIFYKEEYNAIEANQLSKWSNDRGKNILLTIAFMIFCIGIFVISVMLAKANPFKK